MSSLRISTTEPVRRSRLATGLGAADADLVAPLGLVGDERKRLAGVAGKPVGRQPFEAALPVAGVQQRRQQRGRRSLAQRFLHLADETACRGSGVEGHWRSLP